VDNASIQASVRIRYAGVAKDPADKLPYPTGRDSMIVLGYPDEAISNISGDLLRYFVGVGNPFSLGTPSTGWQVLDIGCGAGVDARIAAYYAGIDGRVIGVDMSLEMLSIARHGFDQEKKANITFIEGYAELLPVKSGWADLVISNGALNLATNKHAAFTEIFRVLKPGGRFQAADLILDKPLPDDLLDDGFAWSN